MIAFRRRRRRDDALTRMMRDAHRPEEVDVEAALTEVHRRMALLRIPPPADPPGRPRPLPVKAGREKPGAPASRATPRRWAASARAGLAGLHDQGLARTALAGWPARASAAAVVALTIALLVVAVNAWGVPGEPGRPAPSWRAGGAPHDGTASEEAGAGGRPHRSPSAGPRTASEKLTALAGLPPAGKPEVTPVVGPVTIGGRPFEHGWQVRFDHGASLKGLSFHYEVDTPSRSLSATIGAQNTGRCVWTLSTDNGAVSKKAVESGQTGSITLPLEDASTLSVTVAASGREGHGAVPACSMGDPTVEPAPEAGGGPESPKADQRTGKPEPGSPAPGATPTPPPVERPTAPPSGGAKTERRGGPSPTSSPSTQSG